MIKTKMKKPLCLHLHIFKNAGTTIDWILKKNFSEGALTLDNDNPREIIKFDKVLEHLRNAPKAKSLSSHQIRFPIPTNTEFNFIPIFLIRHPVDRASSIYGFEKRMDIDFIHVLKAKSLSLREYVKWNLESNEIIMKNFQVRFLSKQDNTSSIIFEDLAKARRCIKNSPIIGVVDRMDESLTLAEDFLQRYFHEIDLAYVSQNVDSKKPYNLKRRLDCIRFQIGDELMDELIKKNQLDQELYLESNKELNKRIKRMKDFEIKLLDFKKRCNELGRFRK